MKGKKNTLTQLTAVLISSVFTGAAFAADNCTGYDVLVNTNANTLEVAKNHTLTVSRDASVVTTSDASIYNATTGECAGTFLATPDGKFQGTGFCARRDKDGDSQSIAWSLPAGADKGTWQSVGGTGKFAGKKASGWWQQIRQDGGMVVSKWGGTCN